MARKHDPIQHDPAFKNLVTDFPEDTLRWLLPQAEEQFGKIIKVDFKEIRVEETKDSDNPVLHILAPTLDYPPQERLKWTVHTYIKLYQMLDRRRFEKYMDFVDKYGKIKEQEKGIILQHLNESEEGFMIREAILQEGRQQGIQ